MIETYEHKIRQLYANIGLLITRSMKQRDIQEGIMKEIRTFFNPKNWSLFRRDAITGELFFVITSGLDIEEVRDIRIKNGEGIVGKVAETGESLFIADASKDPRFSSKIDDKTGFVTRTILAVPIVFHGNVYGVIELINRNIGDFFTSEDHLVLQTIANFAAIAYANAAMLKKVETLAYIDPLTGAGNRTALNKKFEKWHKEKTKPWSETKIFMTLIVIDLNNFKEVNDTLGHQTGDEILKKVANQLENLLRKGDKLYRMGGDEFIVVLPNATLERAQIAENRLRGVLDGLVKKLSSDKELSCSFSFGIASGEKVESEKVLGLADERMYEKKKQPNL